MAEVVQRQAHSAEQDYEEVIHLLEAEIAELKMQLAGKKAKHVSEIEVMQPLSLGKTHNPSDPSSVGSPFIYEEENERSIYIICCV